MRDSRVTDKALDLPENRRVRRLAISALTGRAIADQRERDLRDVVGPGDCGLVEDLVSATTSGIAAQLLLTETLLAEGWAWSDILRSVWYRDEALRGAANSA